ncbi:hypothetical protein J8273_7556 [Carpediemonas membranifera]|uniref:Uncharacterized protein n=1 Tax=Carpediemonas membranifera TaxID=201153 RepID=A0A8J6B246_9EUKA|nr:hypothetical protein J8273_7556 [Carpediemonas membranifera]|eukprot:KAG9391352.1 hypothetical protein J8273_7556 [Carpediemonas membranifera]
MACLVRVRTRPVVGDAQVDDGGHGAWRGDEQVGRDIGVRVDGCVDKLDSREELEVLLFVDGDAFAAEEGESGIAHVVVAALAETVREVLAAEQMLSIRVGLATHGALGQVAGVEGRQADLALGKGLEGGTRWEFGFRIGMEGVGDREDEGVKVGEWLLPQLSRGLLPQKFG